MVSIALTIAGSDPSGGAGIQADLKTFHQFEVYGEGVVTLITVQNTRGVTRAECLAADLVEEQIEAVLSDIPPHAIKTGALGNAAIVEAVTRWAAKLNAPWIVDPVMISKNGSRLLDDAAIAAIREQLLPRAALITPNLHEAAVLTGSAVRTLADMRRAAERLVEMGARSALVKGGHLEHDATDVLCDARGIVEYNAPRIETRHTHGTGCTYSAAITALVARGCDVREAVGRAKLFVTEAIRTAPGLGSGAGPLNHWAGV